MAEYDNKAFNNMREAAPDTDIGGAIDISEYEQNMSYWEKEDYKDTLVSTLQSAHMRDPNKGKLGFRDWLENVNWDLQDELFKGWDDIMNMSKSAQKVFIESDPQEFYRRRDAGEFRRLADLHTGNLKDLVGVAKTSEGYYAARDKPLEGRFESVNPKKSNRPSGKY